MLEEEQHLPPADTSCMVCNNICTLECLKCQKCKSSVHIDCSHLPVYAIVNFFNTRSQYTCAECVHKHLGEQSDRLFAQVYSLLEKEREAKQTFAESVDTQTPADQSTRNSQTTASDQRDSDSLGVTQTESDSEHRKVNQEESQTARNNAGQKRTHRKVCYFYKHNKRKFGRKGVNCPYAHPRLCNKYKVNGCDPVKGCKEGYAAISCTHQFAMGLKQKGYA
ncbi:hypothetical protein Pmani_014590 [Petrolisthes manimaculis]|uniref:C3H1-type domain-containing protein n=1 Tax=Petrolisthes manimaculis TaxID=1843537 RepID=A0AAE1PSM4_9EUCA|nr:hypothetical protein Pmani_014590 [Petrolisthes manimaculis]